MIATVGSLWATPFATALGVDLGGVARTAFGVALIMLAAAFLWNVVGAVSARALRAEAPLADTGEETLGAPRSG